MSLDVDRLIEDVISLAGSLATVWLGAHLSHKDRENKHEASE
jgi:hypothetical protein